MLALAAAAIVAEDASQNAAGARPPGVAATVAAPVAAAERVLADASVQTRREAIEEGLDLAADHLPFGVGPGLYARYAPVTTAPHSLPVLAAAETGVLGVAALALLAAAAAVPLLARRRERLSADGEALVAAAGVGVLGWLLLGVVAGTNLSLGTYSAWARPRLAAARPAAGGAVVSRTRVVTLLAVACALFALVGRGDLQRLGRAGRARRRRASACARSWIARSTARSTTGTRPSPTGPAAAMARACTSRPRARARSSCRAPCRSTRGAATGVRTRLAAPQGAEVVVLDELAGDTLGTLRIAASPQVEEAGRSVYSDDERRLTVGLRLPAGGIADVQSMSIAEGGTCR